MGSESCKKYDKHIYFSIVRIQDVEQALKKIKACLRSNIVYKFHAYYCQCIY